MGRGGVMSNALPLFVVTLSIAATVTARSAHADGVSIELPVRVSVVGATVKLGDIAKVEGDADEVARVQTIDLGPAPPVGAPIRLTRAALARWVASRTGQSSGSGERAAQVQWRGAEVVQIELKAQTLTWSRIDAAARERLTNWLDARVDQLKLTPLDRGSDLLVAPGDVRLRPRAMAPDALAQPVMTLWVDVLIDGVVSKTVPVRFRVDGTQRVWVSRSDQPPGIALVAEAFELRDTPLSSIRQRALTVTDLRGMTGSVVGARLRRSVRAGQMLATDDIESAPDVARGKTATLTVSWGAVVVESPVEVMQDGRQGEWVRVRPKTSSEAVLARVAGPGKLEISR